MNAGPAIQLHYRGPPFISHLLPLEVAGASVWLILNSNRFLLPSALTLEISLPTDIELTNTAIPEDLVHNLGPRRNCATVLDQVTNEKPAGKNVNGSDGHRRLKLTNVSYTSEDTLNKFSQLLTELVGPARKAMLASSVSYG